MCALQVLNATVGKVFNPETLAKREFGQVQAHKTTVPTPHENAYSFAVWPAASPVHECKHRLHLHPKRPIQTAGTQKALHVRLRAGSPAHAA